MSNQKKTFEENYNELLEIIEVLQDEDKSLDESIENFKKGIELHQLCKSKLDEAQNTVIKIIGNSNEN